MYHVSLIGIEGVDEEDIREKIKGVKTKLKEEEVYAVHIKFADIIHTITL